jgi:hypothetical protein
MPFQDSECELDSTNETNVENRDHNRLASTSEVNCHRLQHCLLSSSYFPSTNNKFEYVNLMSY